MIKNLCFSLKIFLLTTIRTELREVGRAIYPLQPRSRLL